MNVYVLFNVQKSRNSQEKFLDIWLCGRACRLLWLAKHHTAGTCTHFLRSFPWEKPKKFITYFYRTLTTLLQQLNVCHKKNEQPIQNHFYFIDFKFWRQWMLSWLSSETWRLYGRKASTFRGNLLSQTSFREIKAPGSFEMSLFFRSLKIVIFQMKIILLDKN